jgi:flagellar FliJ protein
MAKKFDFRLESVLNLRSHKVQQAKDSLNHVIKMKNEKEQAIEINLIQRNEIFKDRSSAIKAAELQYKIHHKDHLENEIIQLESEKSRLTEIENLRRLNLTEAMKEEKVLVKLKDKKIEAHKYEVEKEEMQTLDEIAQNKKDSFDDISGI